MLNREKFAKEIMDIALKHSTVSLTTDGKLIQCGEIPCGYCMFYKRAPKCADAFEKWLNFEYKQPEIDWNKVPVDTPVFVWNDCSSKREKRYFKLIEPELKILSYETFTGGRTSWSNDGNATEVWRHCELAREEDKQKYAKKVGY